MGEGRRLIKKEGRSIFSSLLARFFVLYATLLHLPPLRVHCVERLL
jgi:hypothetical protein